MAERILVQETLGDPTSGGYFPLSQDWNTAFMTILNDIGVDTGDNINALLTGSDYAIKFNDTNLRDGEVFKIHSNAHAYAVTAAPVPGGLVAIRWSDEDSTYYADDDATGAFKKGDVLTVVAIGDEPEPPTPPTPPTPSQLTAGQTPLERIAIALEKKAGITYEDKGYLSDKGYLERIADALEKEDE